MAMPHISGFLFVMQADDDCLAVIDQDFVIQHNVHSPPPLILIVYSRLNRGMQ